MAKRILTLCLALVIGIAFAMPAVAAVKSIKVGGDLTIRGIYRDNLDFDKTSTVGVSQSWLMSTTRLWVGAELTDNVSVVVRLLNERGWDVENGSSTDVDLDVAYIKMKDLFIPGLTATLGRQEILLGKGFVVGNVNGLTGSSVGSILAKDLTARKAFDAWRLDYEVGTAPVTVTLFDAKIDETATGTGTSKTTNDDIDLWGLNVGYKTDNLAIEGYALLKDRQTASASLRTDLLTYGARVDHDVLSVPGLNYNLEGALQTGDNGSGDPDKEGWAGNADVSYTFQNPMQPKLGAAWYYASGDAKTTGKGTWVPLYPDNLGGQIGRLTYAYAVNDSHPTVLSNISAPKIYGSFKPSEKHMLSLAYFPTNTINSVSSGAQDEIGSELNLGYAYQYTEDVSFGLCVDYMTAGKAIVPAGSPRDENALQVIGTVAVSF